MADQIHPNESVISAVLNLVKYLSYTVIMIITILTIMSTKNARFGRFFVFHLFSGYFSKSLTVFSIIRAAVSCPPSPKAIPIPRERATIIPVNAVWIKVVSTPN